MNILLRLTIIFTLLYCFSSCSNSDNKLSAVDKRISSSETSKELRETYEEQQKGASTACVFDNPDTTVSDIKLRDAQSANIVLKMERLHGDTTYNFSTQDKKQILSATVHPGDNFSQVSIFKVKYTDNAKIRATALSLDHFVTEKNIKLGVSKNEVIDRLGSCYSTSDSTNKTLTLNYRIENYQDTKIKLLERQNMPIYYGTYVFRNDQLIEFEFGFEYP